MNQSKEQAQTFPQIEMIHKFGSMSGKLKFLADLDLGSITRNETAEELLKDLQTLRKLVDQVIEK